MAQRSDSAAGWATLALALCLGWYAAILVMACLTVLVAALVDRARRLIKALRRA